MKNKNNTLTSMIMLIILVIMMIFSLGADTTFADESLDIKIDSAKNRDQDQRSELDISKYDFFTDADTDIYKEYHNKIASEDDQLKEQLFVTGELKSRNEVTDPAEYASSIGLFSGRTEYELEQPGSDITKDHKAILTVIGFVLLGLLSYAAARLYSKPRRRKG